MNIYAAIILATLIINFVIELLADILNLKNSKGKLPEELSDIYTEEEYVKSGKYLKARTIFGFVTSSYSMALILIFWFAGGFSILDKTVSAYSDSEIIRGLIFIGLLAAGNFILSLPFDIYSTFVIEEKFGFNKTTAKTYILDIFKSGALALALGTPVLAGVLYILGAAGSYAWLYGWGATTIFSLFVQFIAPTWIMPLFNKFTPLKNEELKEDILNYARSVNFSVTNIFEIDGSKRSSKSNAFFTGFGRNKRIALYDTLLEKHNNEELVAILAHEIGHYKKKHILQGMLIGFVHTGVIFYLLSVFQTHAGLYEAFYIERISVYAGLLFFAMLYSPVEMILSVIMNFFSRKNEYQADAFAVITTGKNESLINALKKLSAHNLSNLTPHPFYVFLNYSHPPLLDRIRAAAGAR